MSMKSFVNGDLEKLAAAELKCKCGVVHKLPVRQMLALNNAVRGISYYIKQFGGSAYFLIEKQAAEVCGETIAAKVPQKFRKGASSVQEESLSACGDIIQKIPQDTTVLVAIGGKTACQTGKYISSERNLPLIFTAVIADDDDVLSDRSVLRQENGRLEFCKGKAPQVVFISLNEAVKLCDDLSEAAALICSNQLFSLESRFNFVSKGAYNCAVADSMIAQAAKDFAAAALSKLNKNSIETVFTSLIRISAAKAISKQGAYDTSFLTLCSFISNQTGLDRAVVSGTVFGAVADCFNLVLDNSDILSVPKDTKDLTDEENAATDRTNANYSFEGIKLNKQSLLEELASISKLKAVAAALCPLNASVTKQMLKDALENAGGDGFDGILSYGFASGLI